MMFSSRISSLDIIFLGSLNEESIGFQPDRVYSNSTQYYRKRYFNCQLQIYQI